MSFTSLILPKSGYDLNHPVAATSMVAHGRQSECISHSSPSARNGEIKLERIPQGTPEARSCGLKLEQSSLAAKEQAAAFKRELGLARWMCECMPSTSLVKKTTLIMIIAFFVQPAEAMLIGGFASEIVSFSIDTLLELLALFLIFTRGFKSWRIILLMTLFRIITSVAAQDYFLFEEPVGDVSFDGWAIIRDIIWYLFILIDVLAPLCVAIWFWNKDHDRLEYPNGAPFKHWVFALCPVFIWILLPAYGSTIWFILHAAVYSICIPCILVYGGVSLWWNWMKPTGTILAAVLDYTAAGAPARPAARLAASDPAFVEFRSQQRSIRKAVVTQVEHYHVKYINETVLLCTDLITLCVLQFCRCNPTREEISTFLRNMTQFNLSDEEWINHNIYLPAIVQWKVREHKNNQAKIEDLAEELTDYDELSVRDKQRKYRLFLHSFLGSQGCFTLVKVFVSYLLIAACAFLMIRFVSATYNVVDKAFDMNRTFSSRTFVQDMSFTAQSNVRTPPALKPLKTEFQWVVEPTQEQDKKTKLISIFDRVDMPEEIGFHYDRKDAGNMIKAIEQRVAVTNVIAPLNIQNAGDGNVHYHPWYASMHRHADALTELLRSKCKPPTFPTREEVVAWLGTRHYPQNRTKQILNAYDEAVSLNPEDILKQRSGRVEAFIKEEYYPEFKNPRAILARGDLAKAILGPAFDQLNHLFFELPETVKKLSASKRPAYIQDKCSGPYYYVTDHTAFECSATEDIQRNMEMRVYRALMGPDMHEYLDILLKTQYVKCGNGVAKVPTSRFSGEMNTSLGNSITNYVFIKMLMERFNVTGNFFIEGDDGLLCFEQPLDTAQVSRFAIENGFNLKIAEVARPGLAGFLSTYWDEDCIPYKYPLGKYMAGSAWMLPQSVLTKEQLMLSRLSSMIEENPKNSLLIHLYNMLSVKWNAEKMYVYKPDDNYFREKLDLQGIKYEHYKGMLRYDLPRFAFHPEGAVFLSEHYNVTLLRYQELFDLIRADPIKSYAKLVSVFSLFDNKCTYLDYQLTW